MGEVDCAEDISGVRSVGCSIIVWRGFFGCYVIDIGIVALGW